MNSSANQTNTATRGGMGTTKTPANSGGSGIFGSQAVGATHNEEGSGAGSISESTGNRRQSQESNPMFGGLSSLKRDSSNEGQSQRRTSLGEQGFQPGMLGTMWKNFTGGSNEKGQ